MRLLCHTKKIMETILANGFSWLTRQVPALAFMVFVMISTAWVTVMIMDFSHRLSETERLVNDINTRQLPEIRTQIKDLRLEMERRFAAIDERLLHIELQLNTLITHIETKEGLKVNSLKPNP